MSTLDLKILTPAETDIALWPAVIRAVERINARLIEGHRWIAVAPGIADAVSSVMRAGGWDVQQKTTPGGLHIMLVLTPRIA